MTFTLPYGLDAVLELEMASDALLAVADAPTEPPLADVAGAVSTALKEPINFPPLAQATVSGDRIAVVVESGVPQSVDLVIGTVQSLLACGADAANITVVLATDSINMAADNVRAILQRQPDNNLPCDGCHIVTHDPTDQASLCHVGVSADERAIRINHIIHEADLVLPIGCLRSPCAPGFRGIHGGLFPSFSDSETIDRFRWCECLESDARQAKLREEPAEVARLLGILLTIQVLPGLSGCAARVLAGETRSVERLGKQLCEAAWHFDVPQRASLVVAALSGGAEQQTWENVASSLASAARAVEEDGAIVLCSELSEVPGPMLRQLSQLVETDDLSQAIRHQGAFDAWVTMELAKATARGPVYLLSRLEDDVVEEMGVAPIADLAEIGRLVSRYTSCILMGHAQHRLPMVLGEEAVR